MIGIFATLSMSYDSNAGAVKLFLRIRKLQGSSFYFGIYFIRFFKFLTMNRLPGGIYQGVNNDY